jgi:hypothetical protein
MSIIIVNEEVEKKNSKDNKGPSEFIFKCTLCNYSTNNPTNEETARIKALAGL